MKNLKALRASRREFIKNTGRSALVLSAWDTVLSSLLLAQSSTAQAQTVGQFKSFLHVDMFGSPPRWLWDLFLNPTNDPNLYVPSKMVTNCYTGSTSYTDAFSNLVRYAPTGHFVPHLWSQNVPAFGGGTIPASNLLQNMFNIRGIDVVNAGHPGASELHQAAVVGAPTTSSMTADRAQTLPANPVQNIIRALALNPTPAAIFKSQAGYNQIRFDARGGINNLSQMFSTLQPVSVANNYNNVFVNNKTVLNSDLNQALSAMQPGSAQYYKSLIESFSRSQSILTDASVTVFSDLNTQWDNLYNKYKSLIQRTLAGTYAGINDKPIGRTPTGTPDTNPEWRRYLYETGAFAQNKNASGVVDLRGILSTANYDRLAAQFAVTEFLMVRNITPSIHLLLSTFDGLTFNNGTANVLRSFVFDQHIQGIMPYIYLNSMYYLSLTSCLLELIRVLKQNNLFNDTLIYLSSEFNRSARTDGSGSDHAAPAAHVSLLSGRIPQFKLVGNIFKDSAGVGSAFSANYKGTWGHGAPINGAPLNILQVWASIMVLLGKPISELPNAINRDQLLFRTAGSFALASGYNGAPQNVVNASKV